MNTTLKVDFISDIVCPWCIIGYKRLNQAVNELGIRNNIEIEWHPFELNPDMPPEGENLQEHLMRKYGSTRQESKRTADSITTRGAELGFKFDFFDTMRIVNTRDAHILLDFAKDTGQQTDLKLRLFNAYFNERKDIADRHVLSRELESAGLNSNEALARLDNNDSRERVKAAESYWHGLGVSSVPTLVFNQSSALTGAQAVEFYKQVLTDILSTETTQA